MNQSDPRLGQGGVLVTRPPRFTDPDTPLRVLHKGFDGLDVAFTGALHPADVDKLESCRTTAEAENRDALVALGPGNVEMHVAGTGAKGGYRYRCSTGPFGATWFFKRDQSRNNWNIRVSMNALPLAIYGYASVRSQLKSVLENLGIFDAKERVSRVDYAADFLMPANFVVDAKDFVVHSRTTVAEVAVLNEVTMNPEQYRKVVYSGGTAESVTLGKMPNRQIIIYNKRKEAIAHQKYYWFKIWGIDRADKCGDIWRVEIRAGKKHLDKWQIKSFADLENQFGDLVHKALQVVRYVVRDVSDSNVTRIPIRPLWRIVEEELSRELFNFRSGIIPGRIIEGEQRRIADNYRTQVVSLLPGALLAAGYGFDNAAGGVADYLKKVEDQIKSEPEIFAEKLARASDRLHFILRKSDSNRPEG